MSSECGRREAFTPCLLRNGREPRSSEGGPSGAGGTEAGTTSVPFVQVTSVEPFVY